MVLGAVIALLLGFAAMHLAWMARHLDLTTVYVLALVACFGLYRVRRVCPVAYGTVEILVGFVAIFGAMRRAVDGVADPATLVQMAAGMYVIIRGFDNLAQGPPFKGSAPFRALWRFIRGRKRAE
jgi:hypothetical protein